MNLSTVFFFKLAYNCEEEMPQYFSVYCSLH